MKAEIVNKTSGYSGIRGACGIKNARGTIDSRGIKSARGTKDPRGIEWPTVAIAVFTYASFIAVTFWASALGVWAAMVLLSIILALHSSLQHEVLHGHPFPSRRLSESLVFVAIGLLIPFQRFRALHLLHHSNANLTDPYDDPESNYLDPEMWARMNPCLRLVYRFNSSLLGRMMVGPALSLWVFYRDEVRGLAQANMAHRRAWLFHGLGLLPVAVYWWAASSLPLWAYLGSAYAGLSLLKIRTYLEHQAEADVAARTVIIEDRGILSYLFLNNNFHAVHHSHPKLPWYRLPSFYRSRRGEFLAGNGGYRFRSYGEIFRRYLFAAKDPIVYPLGRDKEEQIGARRK